MSNKRSILITSGLTMMIGLFALPVMLMTFFSGDPFICPISVANAQDSPCLAQEATISALNLQFQEVAFQATLDTINHQATITALQSGSVPVAGGGTSDNNTSTTVVNPPGLPFFEDFSTNNNGWSLLPGVSITGGQLLLNGGNYAIIPTNPVDNFYLEVDADGNDFFIGFGNITGSEPQWHSIRFDACCEIRIYEADKDSWTRNRLFSIDNFNFNSTQRFGISYQNGQLELYADGALITIAQVASYGGELMLGKNFDVFYDNLEIRASR